ncbi:MAG: DMT family transporter, partial [Actinobacteria bacterium]|nr:DMT family transporter [Actinomycetota bacterium]
TALAWATASRLDTIRRSLVLGLTAGMLFGVTSALMKSFADVVTSDGWRLFVHWEPYTMVAVGIAGFVMMQSAFQAGDLRTSLPAIDLAEPLVAGTVGVLLFSEKLRVHGPIQGAAAVLAVVVMAVSAIRLARSAAGEPPGAPDAVVDEPARVDDEASVEPPEGRSIEPV